VLDEATFVVVVKRPRFTDLCLKAEIITFVSEWFIECFREDFSLKRGKGPFRWFLYRILFSYVKKLIIVNNNENYITSLVREGPRPCVPKEF